MFSLGLSRIRHASSGRAGSQVHGRAHQLFHLFLSNEGGSLSGKSIPNTFTMMFDKIHLFDFGWREVAEGGGFIAEAQGPINGRGKKAVIDNLSTVAISIFQKDMRT